jgi:quinol monooxygenase YgiN
MAMRRGRRTKGRQIDMFEVTARLTVRPGELEGFRRQAAEMMRLTEELDTKTVRYDWFLSDDETECEVREAYVDADALIEDAQHIGEARNTLFRDFADGHTITFYADPSPALAKAMESMPPGAVTVKQFVAFQPDAEVAGQVPAEPAAI